MMSLKAELIALSNSNCQDCTLASKRINIVPGRGGIFAKIVGIGEGPGKVEDIEGRAFKGPAGKLLDSFANDVGIDTNMDMFLTNTVLCRPKAEDYDGRENRQPSPEEIAACFPKVKNIVDSINPRLIVLFGVPALRTCMPKAPKKIGLVAGKFFPPEMHVFDSDADVYVMYHPSYILRYPAARKKFLTDFARLKHYAVGAEIL